MLEGNKTYCMNPSGEKPNVRVGVGVIVLRGGKILMGKRKNAHGEGAWALPGGHLEHGESWEECARRETLEETGLQISNVRFAAATNDIFQQEQKHHITLFMLADADSGEARAMEPEKCEKWEWLDRSEWPERVFLPVSNLLKSGFDPFAQTDPAKEGRAEGAQRD